MSFVRNMGSPKVLFFTSAQEDYLSDSLFHGLRSVLGENVIDFPKNEIMYRTSSETLRSAGHGRGFTLYGLLEDQPIERFRSLQRLRDGQFDLVVFSDIWRQYGYYLQFFPFLKKAKVAVIDGADSPRLFAHSGERLRHPELWGMPDPGRFTYFKRELTPETGAVRFLGSLPRWLAKAVGRGEVSPISFSIPEEKILPFPPPKSQIFPLHIVDSEVRSHLNRNDQRYVFEREADYFKDLQKSKFGITTRRAGWDCLRHYEIASNGALLCFRDLDYKPDSCAPHGLSPKNSISYRSLKDLLSKTSALSDEKYVQLQGGCLEWARQNSTVRRADWFLSSMGV